MLLAREAAGRDRRLGLVLLRGRLGLGADGGVFGYVEEGERALKEAENMRGGRAV